MRNFTSSVIAARSKRLEYSNSSHKTWNVNISILNLLSHAQYIYTCKTLRGSKSSTGNVILDKSLPIVCFRMAHIDKLNSFIGTGKWLRCWMTVAFGTGALASAFATWAGIARIHIFEINHIQWYKVTNKWKLFYWLNEYCHLLLHLHPQPRISQFLIHLSLLMAATLTTKILCK